MTYVILFQIAPPIALAMGYLYLERYPAFTRYSLPILFVFGAALQLGLWAASHPNLENPDSFGYFQLGHGQVTDLRLILFRPKLYPLFLSLFAAPKAATLVQCLLKLATGLWIPRMGARLGWRPAFTAWAATLYLFHSLWLQEPLRILDTTLFTFLFSSALCLGYETLVAFAPRRLFAFALFAGLASLTRQVGDGTLLFLALVVLIHFRRMLATKPKLFLGAGLMALLIAHVGALWNGWHYHAYLRTVALGNALYTHASFFALVDASASEWNWVEPSLPGARQNLGAWDPFWKNPIPWPVNALPHDLERARGVEDLPSILARDREFKQRFYAWVQAKPTRYLASIGNELQRLFWKCEEIYPNTPWLGFNESNAQLSKSAVAAPNGVWHKVGQTAERIQRGLLHQPIGILWLLGFIGWMRRPRQAFAFGILWIGVSGYFLLIAAIHMGFTRYALPTLPVLYILCAHAIDTWFSFLNRNPVKHS